MAVNARTEEFQHIEVFDKPALFTNGRIARDTVPEGWYCYDIRGSDDDPAGKSGAAGHKTTVTSWKRSITATACVVIRPLVTITGI